VERTKIVFKATVGGAEREYCVTRPDSALKAKAQLFKAAKIREAAAGGALLRDEVDKLLRDRGVWDEQKQQLYVKLAKALRDDEAEPWSRPRSGGPRRARGGTSPCGWRPTSSPSVPPGRAVEPGRADGRGDGGRGRVRLPPGPLRQDGRREALLRLLRGHGGAGPSAPSSRGPSDAFMELLYGSYEDQLKKRPEWQFLLQHKFVNDKLRLVNKDGHLVDGLGRRVDARRAAGQRQGRAGGRPGPPGGRPRVPPGGRGGVGRGRWPGVGRPGTWGRTAPDVRGVLRLLFRLTAGTRRGSRAPSGPFLFPPPPTAP
jgi:hypothetical protein